MQCNTMIDDEAKEVFHIDQFLDAKFPVISGPSYQIERDNKVSIKSSLYVIGFGLI